MFNPCCIQNHLIMNCIISPLFLACKAFSGVFIHNYTLITTVLIFLLKTIMSAVMNRKKELRKFFNANSRILFLLFPIKASVIGVLGDFNNRLNEELENLIPELWHRARAEQNSVHIYEGCSKINVSVVLFHANRAMRTKCLTGRFTGG